MATVATSAQSDVISYPTVPAIGRDMSVGGLANYMYVVVHTATDTLSIYRSTNEGSSWSLFSSFTHTGLQEWSSPVVERNGWLHLAYRSGTGTEDAIWYKRMNCNTGVWSTALRTSGADANGGVIGSRWSGVDLAVARSSNGSYAIAVCGAYASGTSVYGMIVMGVSISDTGTVTLNNGIILNNRSFNEAGTAPGRSSVSCEVEHNGDGFTSSTPHLWVSWGRTKLRMVKLAWQGSTVGWSGPSNFQVIRNPIAAHDFVGGRWDGQQWLMAVISPDDTTMVRVYQRNQANTLTTSFDTLTHPTGNIRAMTLSYDNTTKDMRVFALGTSTAVLYYCDYTRATASWTAWATVSATAIGPAITDFSVRRGGSADNSRIDVITVASGSPNTVTHTAMTTNSIPSVATWQSQVAHYNGGPADVGAALVLAWNFSDPDPGQIQGSFALSRQIGAGSLAYWRASDQTWQASEVQNSSSLTSISVASGWATATDSPYAFRVKVWDNTNTPASGYSDAYVLIPSTPVNPTVSAPGAGSTINTSTVTVAWTASEQRGYRITLEANPSAGIVWDSNWVPDTTATSADVPVNLANATAWTVKLYTLNNELLSSVAQSRNFSVAYAPPPAPYPVLVPSAANGYIVVTSAAASAIGTQPTIDRLSLFRRAFITPILNSNNDMTTTVTGYSARSGFGTVTWSAAQAAPSSTGGSARMVPNGTFATPQVESALVVIDGSALYLGSGWIRPDTANKPITVNVNFYNSSNTFISAVTTSITPVALAWQYLEVLADASAVTGAAKATISIGEASTPAASDAFYADDLRLKLYNYDAGITLRTGLSHPAVINDWGAAGGTPYEYRLLASGTNGTLVYGPWTS